MAPTRVVFENVFKTPAMVYVSVSRVADPKHLTLVGADTMVKMHGSNEPHSAVGRRLFSAAVVRQLPTEGTQLPPMSGFRSHAKQSDKFASRLRSSASEPLYGDARGRCLIQ